MLAMEELAKCHHLRANSFQMIRVSKFEFFRFLGHVLNLWVVMMIRSDYDHFARSITGLTPPFLLTLAAPALGILLAIPSSNFLFCSAHRATQAEFEATRWMLDLQRAFVRILQKEMRDITHLRHA